MDCASTERNTASFAQETGFGSGRSSFFDGEVESDADLEARLWIESLVNDTETVVKPEQALVVSEILEESMNLQKQGRLFILINTFIGSF